MGANYSLKGMLCWSYSSSLSTVFDSISSNIDEVLSIIPSANVFVLETLTFIIRTGLPILVELIDLVKAVISNNLTQIANFPSHISDCDSHSPALLDLFLFFWCYYLFYNGFPSIGKFWSSYCLSFHWLSILSLTGCLISVHSLWLFLCWLRQSLRSWSFERCAMGGFL